ncbi:MAG: hypothetical protein ACRD0U_09740, partial [Acidimicrobiales bacterium]
MGRRLTAAAVAGLCLVSMVGCGTESGGRRGLARGTPALGPLGAASGPPLTEATTTTVPTTLAPETTAAPTTTAPPVAPAVTTAPAPAPPLSLGMAPYQGLGTWLDTYDWSVSVPAIRNPGYSEPAAGPADVDRMAALGVQTLFVQTAHHKVDADVLEPERLLPIIERAHHVGLRVVAWYLPALDDPATDLRRLVAAAQLPVDGLAVDIEYRSGAFDVTERNRRLVELSANLRAALPGQVLGAIVLPPVVMEDINPDYWPGFPWAELAPWYDVWLPMSYWTNRATSSGWRDGYGYTAANIDRVRANLGQPGAAVHTIGGIGDASSEADVNGMR